MPVFLPSAIAGTLATFGMLSLAGASEDGEPALDRLAPEPDPSWQIDTTLSARKYSLQYAEASPSTYGTGMDLDVDLIRFMAPLRDDGAPYSLQPFLQRSSQWSLSLDGTHFSTHNPFGGDDRTDWIGGISGALDAYVKPWLALTAGLGYGVSVLHDVGVDQTTRTFRGGFGFGLRAANTRFDAWYGLIAEDVAGSALTIEDLPAQVAPDGSVIGYHEVEHAVTFEAFVRFDQM
jgi:hypothetical protein